MPTNVAFASFAKAHFCSAVGSHSATNFPPVVVQQAAAGPFAMCSVASLMYVGFGSHPAAVTESIVAIASLFMRRRAYHPSMAMPRYASVAKYLAAQPAPARKVLSAVRAIVKKALPRAEETLSYQIPTYKLHDRAVLFFAAWKAHFSLYPVSTSLAEALGDALAPYRAAKGTLRFSYTDPLPAKLIERIAKLRAAEIEASATKPAKRAAKKAPAARRKSAR